MDEGFIPDSMILARWGALPPINPREAIEAWPEGLPTDFDHRLLREFRLPCGNDEGHEHYALLREHGGWRVWKVSDLVKGTMDMLMPPAGVTP